jgi:hypothetical protein
MLELILIAKLNTADFFPIQLTNSNTVAQCKVFCPPPGKPGAPKQTRGAGSR